MDNIKGIARPVHTVILAFFLSFSLLLTGCGGGAPILELESSSYSIRSGEAVTLTWNAETDDSDVIDQRVTLTTLGDVSISGSSEFSPESTTIVRLTDVRTSTKGEESVVTKEITVHVDLLLSDWEAEDQNFGRCVREQNESSVYALDVRAVDCSHVSSLEGAQYLGGLTELVIKKGLLKDILPIKTLHELSTLGLVSVPIRDLAPIEELSGLFALYIIDTAVTDVASIGKLSDTVGVWIGMNNISSGLVELEPLLAQMNVYAGWVDLRSSIWGIANSNKRIDCEAVNAFRAQTEYGNNVFWPEYCDG